MILLYREVHFHTRMVLLNYVNGYMGGGLSHNRCPSSRNSWITESEDTGSTDKGDLAVFFKRKLFSLTCDQPITLSTSLDQDKQFCDVQDSTLKWWHAHITHLKPYLGLKCGKPLLQNARFSCILLRICCWSGALSYLLFGCPVCVHMLGIECLTNRRNYFPNPFNFERDISSLGMCGLK